MKATSFLITEIGDRNCVNQFSSIVLSERSLEEQSLTIKQLLGQNYGVNYVNHTV